ncbi:cation-translocating P-type ATPase [Pontibacillus yanchengensis]|uniref:HAD family hydrolase n=1 Tax=Pontibacillus yanchengensis Y32 TaxID=1385514 RepID=A0A0A2TCX0_9BACI|nr:HAD-IC family P-type ATPase [Pontibacillus yanchengensis]KGP73697.1 HAD family hydrolase [Pontibacillus yanchengensis Y32]
MESISIQKRSFQAIDGRLRFELYDLENNEHIKNKFEKIFSTLPGIQSVEASVVTGRVLIQYVDSILSLSEVTKLIQSFEKAWFYKKHKQHEVAPEVIEDEQQAHVAATYEDAMHVNRLGFMPVEGRKSRTLPFAVMLSMGGVLVLSMKRWIWGPSFWAAHPIPFYLSAATAILTGYPFFKRSIDLADQKKPHWKIDWLLGASSLALGLVRENVVVLAGLTILNTLNWKRQKAHLNDASYLEESPVLPEIKRYNNRMGKLGFAAAGANLAITRNPFTTLGLLLAANPRPSRIASEFSWKQAELDAKEQQWTVPEHGSLFHLSQVNTIITEDPAVLVENHTLRPEAHEFLQTLPDQTNIIIGSKKKNLQAQQDAEQTRYTVASMYPHLCVKDANTSYPAERHHALVIRPEKEMPTHNLASYYPSIMQDDLAGLTQTMKKVFQIRKTNLRQLNVTKGWNLFGSILAVTRRYSAPVINLMADSLILMFLSHNQKETKPEKQKQPKTRDVQTASALEEDAPVFTWHAEKEKQLVDQFHSDTEQGLSSLQVKTKRLKHGKNEWKMKEKPHWFVTYFEQLKEFTTIILGSTALISMLQGHIFDGMVMGSILLANAGIGAYQERKAANLLDSVNDFKPPISTVIRNGKEIEVPATELVPGDIVNIEAGDRVPADLRLLRSWNMEVNEATLTGESLPVPKNVGTLDSSTTVADRSNMLFMGTDLTRGRGRAIVVGTGTHTEMGHLLVLLSDEKDEKTILQQQVDSVSKKFLKLALITGSLVFLTGVIRGITLGQMLTTSIALAASAIPEGLPVTITIALSAGVLRLSKKKAVTRRLSALESMGRVTVICSDKTGTLTKNEMTVTKVATPSDLYEVSGNGYEPEGTITCQTSEATNAEDLDALMKVGWLCQNTSLYKEEDEWKVKGDPTEAAILTLAHKHGYHDQDFSEWHRVHEIPFDSQRGMMSVVCKEHRDHKDCFVMTKGSLEKVLDRCTHFQVNGMKKKLTDKQKTAFKEQNHQFADEALRVIAFAYAPITSEPDSDSVEEVERDLTFVGMVGMIDPPKSDVKDSIEECYNLGIRPVMITGDHPKTAQAIGKQVGLEATPESILTGQEIDQMDDQDLFNCVNDISIFARVTPDHKLRIVTALQEHDHVVAMSGDGVNDSPAIKKANVGIAMGQTGTEVTKESADIVLTEDHFQIILDAVKQGRSIIGNIRRALGCLLSGNIAEIIVTSVAVVAGLPLPIIPIQILLMNLLTDALPAMVFAINPGQSNAEEPRKKIADSSLYKQVITRGLLLGSSTLALFAFTLGTGATLLQAQTIAFATLVTGQLIQTFSWRKHGTDESFLDFKRDRFLIGAISISALSLLSVIYVPTLANMFSTATLQPIQWLYVLAAAGSSALISRPITAMLQRKEQTQAPEEAQPELALVS